MRKLQLVSGYGGPVLLDNYKGDSRNMRTKFFSRAAVVAALVGVPFAALGTGAASAASHSTVTFKGSITCGFSGTLTANPGIKLSSAKTTITLKLSLVSCKGTTKSGGVTITGGTVTASKSITASCTSLGSFTPPVLPVVWKSTGGSATKSSVTFSSASAAIGTPIKVTLPGSGGTGKVTGSFAGSKAKGTAVVKQSTSQLLSACSSSSGVKTLNLTSASTVTVA